MPIDSAVSLPSSASSLTKQPPSKPIYWSIKPRKTPAEAIAPAPPSTASTCDSSCSTCGVNSVAQSIVGTFEPASPPCSIEPLRQLTDSDTGSNSTKRSRERFTGDVGKLEDWLTTPVPFKRFKSQRVQTEQTEVKGPSSSIVAIHSSCAGYRTIGVQHVSKPRPLKPESVAIGLESSRWARRIKSSAPTRAAAPVPATAPSAAPVQRAPVIRTQLPTMEDDPTKRVPVWGSSSSRWARREELAIKRKPLAPSRRSSISSALSRKSSDAGLSVWHTDPDDSESELSNSIATPSSPVPTASLPATDSKPDYQLVREWGTTRFGSVDGGQTWQLI